MKSEGFLSTVQLEFINNPNGIRTYVSLLYGKIPDYENNPCKGWLRVIVCGGEHQDFIVEKFEGSQKMLLPEACSLLIINSLLSNESVSIDLQMGESTFHSSNFSKQWALLLR
jgi:hypothetical protein